MSKITVNEKIQSELVDLFEITARYLEDAWTDNEMLEIIEEFSKTLMKYLN